MPAVSIKQRQAAAIALHHPERVYKRNKAMTRMSKKQLREFASTKEDDLDWETPKHKADDILRKRGHK